MPEAKRDDSRVVVTEFARFLTAGLRLLGVTAIGLEGNAFDRACKAAADFLTAKGMNLRFRITPHPLHGTSLVVRDQIIPRMVAARHAHLCVPADGMLHIDMTTAWALGYLNHAPGSINLWRQAADIFLDTYQNPPE